ncbi:HAMP domain-containing histidine kinase [Lichenicoccus roseus]|uniref:histidine kinase n=1 Tax=Lichenicoccus roseus TaxID=2683649 RepID=A0A5R9JD11_9PROT|nr:HAMP domain-containing histidine kinase [Lichenicoccus roseus]
MLGTGIFGTSTFRLSLGSAGFLLAALLLQSALIFWQTTSYQIMRTDLLLAREAALITAQSRPLLDQQLRMRASDDLHLLIAGAGLFDARHHVLNGNLPDYPEGLQPDGPVQQLVVHPTGQGPRIVRAQALRLRNGDILVLARGLRDLEEVRFVVLRALLLCAVPSTLLAVAGGAWLSHRALLRVGIMHRAVDRIMAGDLHERLPAGRERDDLDRLAGSVNRMLDRLEHLLDEIKGVGDDIAHDLRTPLARVRTRLERARNLPPERDRVGEMLDRAIADLDQCFSVITALLRIGEIENGRRRAAFATVELTEIVDDIVDLYEPIAEARQIALLAGRCEPVRVHGDRDLLIELVANLIDNAIKFTPEGGRVEIGARARDGAAVLHVADSGPGIAAAEREAVLGRFYRSDKSRHVPGSGLGLSLVGAIGRLHDARITIADAGSAPGPGCLIEVALPIRHHAIAVP